MAWKTYARIKPAPGRVRRALVAAVIGGAVAAVTAGPAPAYTVDMPIHSSEEVLDGTSNALRLAEALSYSTRLELPGLSPIAISSAQLLPSGEQIVGSVASAEDRGRLGALERGQRFDAVTLVTPRSRYELRDVLVSGHADGGTQVVIAFCKTDQASLQPYLN